jgi:VWFA-related protein
VKDLQPGDFTVRIDGAERRVVSVEWVALAGAGRPPAARVPDGYSSNQSGSGGRLILVVVDQPSIRPGDALAVMQAAGDFLDRLEPSDRVAAVSLGIGSGSTPFTPDRERVKEALGRMAGTAHGFLSFDHELAISEAVAIAADPSREQGLVFGIVVARECRGLDGVDLGACRDQILAQSIATELEVRSATEQTLRSLTALLEDLSTIDAPKTMVLVSGGFVVRDQQADVSRLGALAAAARTTVYALRLDDLSFGFVPGGSAIGSAGDRLMRSEGLDLLAASTRGASFDVAGSGLAAFAQIETELSGYYLVGIESEAGDNDGRAHPIEVTVDRSGVTVRARKQLAAQNGPGPRSPRESVIAGLTSPLVLSALPLRVTTFSVREPETPRVQLLIHADIGSEYATPAAVSLGYVISSASGRIVHSQSLDARLPPAVAGIPSPLQFQVAEAIEPGEYTLKLSVVEGDRIGTVEHPLRAGLVPAGSVQLSDLMVGGPFSGDAPLRPTVGYTIAFGTVHGYLEAYGSEDARLAVKYEVAAAEDAPPLLEADVEGVPGGHERTIYSGTLGTSRLPPGKYVLRAVVSSRRQALRIMSRPFEVGAPPVLMASAENTAPVATVPTDLYLPVSGDLFARPFRRDDAARAETVRAFREAVAAASRPAFDKGVASLASGEYTSAEESFKSALRTDDQSSAALAYLAATFAASGHDAEAAAAWQTSLIDGSRFPEIFLWLGDALLRTRQLAEARTVLEEAASKWPADLRFAKPLALVYATFGQGREAVRTLERYLSTDQNDSEALALGVEWLYHLHAAGAVARTAAEDLALATTWANRYAGANGPLAALVGQWLQALQGNR